MGMLSVCVYPILSSIPFAGAYQISASNAFPYFLECVTAKSKRKKLVSSYFLSTSAIQYMPSGCKHLSFVVFTQVKSISGLFRNSHNFKKVKFI